MPFAEIPSVADLLPGAISGLWTLGDVAGAHAEIGTHPNDGSTTAGHSGIRLYDAAGNAVVELNAITGAATFLGSVQIGSTVPGSTVTGAVASATTATTATSATTATTATSATTATTATNLAGGGTASGITTIAGRLVVGPTSGSHVVVGSDGASANGVCLYGSDGVTPLINLSITGTPTITGSVIKTTGGSIVLDGPNNLLWIDNSGTGNSRIAPLGNGMRFLASSSFGSQTLDFTATGGLLIRGTNAPLEWKDTTKGIAVDAGSVNVTTDASGSATFSHGLGATPRSVQITDQVGPTQPRVTGTTSTTITIAVRNQTGTALLTNTALSYYWVAVG